MGARIDAQSMSRQHSLGDLEGPVVVFGIPRFDW
jgi:hypothetical protein